MSLTTTNNSFLIWQKISVSVGAGLYEEFIFRMLIFALIHMLIVDLIQANSKIAIGISLLLSTLLFILYHEPNNNLKHITFYGCAGIYLGIIYFSRGFGIAVGTHAIYDLVALGAIIDTSSPN